MEIESKKEVKKKENSLKAKDEEIFDHPPEM